MIETKAIAHDSSGKWVYAAALAGLLSVYSQVFYFLYNAWILDPYYSHGFIVPLISLYLIWAARKRIQIVAEDKKRHTLLPFAAGFFLYFFAIILDLRFLMYISFVVSTAGLILYIWGPKAVKVIRFPLIYLFLMFPLPYSLTSSVAFSLQLTSSRYSTLVLDLLGISALREGVNIHIPGYSFIIERGCSGLQSTVALFTLAVLFAYLVSGPVKNRVFLVFSAIPIALMANVARIVLVILMAKAWGRQVAESFFHTFSSLFLFSLAFLLMAGTARYVGCLPSKR